MRKMVQKYGSKYGSALWKRQTNFEKEEMPDMVVVTEPVVLLDETGSKSTVDRNCSCPQHTQTPAGHPPAASDSN